MSPERVDRRFYDAFAGISAPRAPLNADPLMRELQDAIRAAGRLGSYRSFLADARALKARRGGSPLAFEREVLAHADAAVGDMRRLFAPTLRATRHMRYAGALDEALERWSAGVRSVGTVRLRDIWADARDDQPLADAIGRLGLTEKLLREIDGELERVELTSLVDAGRPVLEVKPTGADRASRLLFARPGPVERPRNIAELLARDRFDTSVATYERDGLLAAEVVPAVGAPPAIDPVDGVLAGAILATQQLARHRRGLADAGLATHAGDDPTVVGGVLIAGAVLLALGGALLLVCGAGGGGDPESGPEPICTMAEVLMALGLFMMSGAVCVLIGGQPCAAGVALAVVIFLYEE